MDWMLQNTFYARIGPSIMHEVLGLSFESYTICYTSGTLDNTI